MDLTLKVSKKESTSMSKLLKQMCALKCRIKVDLKEGNLSILEMDDSYADDVIDSIDEVFVIEAIDIVPKEEIQKEELPKVEKPVTTEKTIATEGLILANPIPEVEEQLRNLKKIVYWATNQIKAPSRDICQYLISIGAEITMKYKSREKVKFSIGDIVECNYGKHLYGEISGGHVHSIVCKIDENGMVYVVPITRDKPEGYVEGYLPFKNNFDVNYIDSKCYGGYILYKMGSYISSGRVQSVLGNVKPRYFQKLLYILTKENQFHTGDYAKEFFKRNGDVQNDDAMLEFENKEKVLTPQTPDSPQEDENTGKVSDDTKKVSAGDYVESLIRKPLEALNKSKPIEEQLEVFLDSIGFSKNDKIINQSFIAACEVKKVVYENIILELRNVFPEIEEDLIKETMSEHFKEWLSNYPEVKQMYPKVSFMVLLKAFAKNMK